MIRARVWFRCAAMGDPVTPVVVRPAVIGWEARQRKVGLTIERAFKGEELVDRMKGWVTVDVRAFRDALSGYGQLKVLDERSLVVETETEADYRELGLFLSEQFGERVELERL